VGAISIDQGSELVWTDLDLGAYVRDVELHFSRLGKPTGRLPNPVSAADPVTGCVPAMSERGENFWL
jgi:hypothetical protein